MKRMAVFLAAIIMLSFSGCGGVSQSDYDKVVAERDKLQQEQSAAAPLTDTAQSNVSSIASQVSSAPANYPEAVIGETISTEKREIIINKAELSYDVLPSNPASYYQHYPAEEGKVYVNVAFTVKNLQQQSLPCDEVLTMQADYNEGYSYNGFTVVEEAGTFTYSSITNIAPLDTMSMNYLFECPDEVEKNTAAPLYIIINIENTDYKLTIR